MKTVAFVKEQMPQESPKDPLDAMDEELMWTASDQIRSAVQQYSNSSHGYSDGPGSGQALYSSPKKKKKVIVRNAWSDIPVEKTYEPSRMEEVELMGALTPSDNEEFDDVKDAMQILRSTERTIVFAIAVDKKNEDNNVMSSIRCNGGTAFGGYARDAARDSYIVQCVEFLQLGSVAFSYVVTMPSAGNWQVKVPIPETVLEKYFNPQQLEHQLPFLL
jgi:hypothetical protein